MYYKYVKKYIDSIYLKIYPFLSMHFGADLHG
jgi:hypothetical protein